MAVQKILVVDDEARMRKLVSDFLVREGFEVLEASFTAIKTSSLSF